MSLPTCPTCVYAKGICKKTGVEIRTTTGCTYHTPKLVTNADRIRAMSDEELAGHLVCEHTICTREKMDCNACMLEWLKEEAVSNG